MRLAVTRVLSSAYKGDFAIALAMLAQLNAVRPDWQLTIFCRNPDSDSADLDRFGTVLPELFSDVNGSLQLLDVGTRILRYLLWSMFRLPFLDQPGKLFVDALSRTRAMAFCGGGSPGGYGLHNLVLHAAVPVIMARKMDLPVVFTGVGCEPEPGAFQRLITRWILNRASLVIARDPSAAQSMREQGVTSDVRVAGDWAFLLPVEDGALLQGQGQRQGGRLRLGMNLRDPGATGAKGEPQSERLLHMSAVCTELLERTEAEIFVFSMNKSRATDDFRFASRVRDSLPHSLKPRVSLVPVGHPPGYIKGCIATMDIFVSTRLHPAIFALSAGVPTLALHHAAKVRDMMHYFQLAEYYLPIDEASPAEITARVLEMAGDLEEIRHEIEEKTPLMRDAAGKNVELLAASLSGMERKD